MVYIVVYYTVKKHLCKYCSKEKKKWENPTLIPKSNGIYEEGKWVGQSLMSRADLA